MLETHEGLRSGNLGLLLACKTLNAEVQHVQSYSRNFDLRFCSLQCAIDSLDVGVYLAIRSHVSEIRYHNSTISLKHIDPSRPARMSQGTFYLCCSKETEEAVGDSLCDHGQTGGRDLRICFCNRDGVPSNVFSQWRLWSHNHYGQERTLSTMQELGPLTKAVVMDGLARK